MNIPPSVKCDGCDNTRPDPDYYAMLLLSETAVREHQELVATWSTYHRDTLNLDLCPSCTASVSGFLGAWCSK